MACAKSADDLPDDFGHIDGHPDPRDKRISDLEARLSAVSELSDECVNALTRKTQVDEDGTLVGVSHQAVDDIYDALIKARAK